MNEQSFSFFSKKKNEEKRFSTHFIVFISIMIIFLVQNFLSILNYSSVVADFNTFIIGVIKIIHLPADIGGGRSTI